MKLKDKKDRQRKVLFYGNDGTGKTYQAVKYCDDNNLEPVLIDIEDTCFEEVDIAEIDQKNPRLLTKSIVDIINEVTDSKDYDTVILDGVSTLLEELVSNSPGLKAYKDRADSFGLILKAIRNSKINIIFIGQADMRIIVSEEYTSNKPIIKLNAMVNEKYLCKKTDKGFEVETIKYRR